MSSRDPLDDLLDRWHPPAHLVPDLRAEIRREIARATPSHRGSWLTRLDRAFAQPSFAITFVAACVLLGLFLAEARVSRLHAAYGAQIARSYVQLIDPLLDAQPTAPAATTNPAAKATP
ncbi:hypothetical protein [Opitutus sp. ER46]|uniref:hypothetical protein n=1 Tax=Opitutus sp. ER46 TaxID=2161864 RepID=UPI000D304211|nr:hypothetical protein [Opitutus sp. ER46]PTX95476.1 hypothetical protein DB354_08600 [Opitutus sp. ER46]